MHRAAEQRCEPAAFITKRYHITQQMASAAAVRVGVSRVDFTMSAICARKRTLAGDL
jgi:hypothetical protein